MLHAIFSDVHANVDALEAVLEDARERGADNFVSLGDCVGYGPEPRAALALIRRTASISLLGNHDAAVIGKLSTDDFTDSARESVVRHRAVLSRLDRHYLQDRPLFAMLPRALAVHGDMTSPEAFRYIDSPERAAENFAATIEPLLFVGHTHIAEFFVTGSSGEVYRFPAEDFICEEGKRYIVNVGTVGLPREEDGTSYSTYVLYDDKMRTVRFRRIPFAARTLLSKGPSKEKKSPLGRILLTASALLFACGVLALGLFAMFSTIRSTAPSEESVLTTDEARQEFVTRRLTLSSDDCKVAAELQLEKTSPAGLLNVIFFDARGEKLKTTERLVKKSCTRHFAVPAKTVEVVFELHALKPNEVPRIETFSPRVVTSSR